MALGTWQTTHDPSVYGAATLRMERAEAYVKEFRRVTGKRLTLSHMMAKAAAAALETFKTENPDQDFGVKLLVSPSRKRYLRQHWLEAAIVVAPFFRPLYLVRFFLFGSRAILGMRRLAEIDLPPLVRPAARSRSALRPDRRPARSDGHPLRRQSADSR